MPVASLDPDAALIMKLSSEVIEAREVIRRQREQIDVMSTALKATQHAMNVMQGLVDLVTRERR